MHMGRGSSPVLRVPALMERHQHGLTSERMSHAQRSRWASEDKETERAKKREISHLAANLSQQLSEERQSCCCSWHSFLLSLSPAHRYLGSTCSADEAQNATDRSPHTGGVCFGGIDRSPSRSGPYTHVMTTALSDAEEDDSGW